MARTQDYMNALDSRIEIAPANSEEELAAAAFLEDLCKNRGLEVSMEEFDCPKNTSLLTGVLLILPFIGIILSGIPGIGMSVLGLFVMALGLGGLYLITKPNSPLLKICGTARSQNVVAFHKGVGPKSGKGVRPIVVLAHYDTGREDIFAKEPFAKFSRYIYSFAPYGLMFAALMCVLEMIVVLPTFLLVVFCVLGAIACIPALLWGVEKISHRYLPLTPSANDNKSGIACLFDVMDAVASREGDDIVEVDSPVELEDAYEDMVESQEREEEFEQEADVAAETGVIDVPEEELVEEISNEVSHKGIWHGEDFIRAVGIVPEDCEITYVHKKPKAQDTARLQPVNAAEADVQVVESIDDTSDLGDVHRTIRAEYFDNEETSETHDPMGAIKATFGNLRNFATKAINRGKSQALEDVPEIPHSEEGLHAAEVERQERAQSDSGSTQAMAMEQFSLTTPAEPGDSTWGMNEYEPQNPNRSTVRRVSLFDLPDPNESTIDPLAPTEAEVVSFEANDTAAYAPTQVPNAEIETLATSEVVAPVPVKVKRNSKGHKSHRHAKTSEQSMTEFLGIEEDYDAKIDGEEIGDWNHFNSDKGSKGWKGGAAKSEELRDSDYDLDVVELQEEVLEFGDEDLVAHDIWFVATGASSLEFAGSKDFLERHRKQLRGALVFSVTGVGAGTISILTTEGAIEKRRVDRRILRTLKGVASDLHVSIDEVPRAWVDTDATPFMRNSIRSASIVGLDEGDVIAFADTQEDVIENIDMRQITQVAQLITEAIRRS